MKKHIPTKEFTIKKLDAFFSDYENVKQRLLDEDPNHDGANSITANIPNTPMQHGYKTHHFTVTALHTLNNTVAKGCNQMAPLARTITVALDMSKAFDTINIHTLIIKLLQTNIPAQSLSLSQTTLMDAKPTKHIETRHPDNVNLKLAFHKVASFHPHYLTFIPQTYHYPLSSAPVQVMAYADDITITSTRTSTSAAKKYIQPYLHKVFLPGQHKTILY